MSGLSNVLTGELSFSYPASIAKIWPFCRGYCRERVRFARHFSTCEAMHIYEVGPRKDHRGVKLDR
jgi:hypothetical protein